jgi:hypothetical protein
MYTWVTGLKVLSLSVRGLPAVPGKTKFTR